jgi:hypothetical protein
MVVIPPVETPPRQPLRPAQIGPWQERSNVGEHIAVDDASQGRGQAGGMDRHDEERV